jgi:Kef-type K+ transport system membrane component KefB
VLHVDATSFLVIVVAAAAAGILVAVLDSRLTLPVVVVELMLGIVVGPDLADIASVDQFTDFFGNLGLGFLFFFAGYEIDFDRIRGRPLQLAIAGWALSLAIAYGVGGVLEAAGIVLSLLYSGSATATTAVGTLIRSCATAASCAAPSAPTSWPRGPWGSSARSCSSR